MVFIVVVFPAFAIR